MSNIDALDISVLVVYFIAVILTGFLSMLSSNRKTVKGYFLANKSLTWLPVGASLFASNIGSEHFIGLAGSGAASGIGASLLLLLLGWVFLPVYIASGVYTLPEYMKRRFGSQRIQIYLDSLSLFLYVVTKISVNLYAGALFLRVALDWNLWISIALLLALTCIITVFGGLTAVLYTDTVQCFVMVLGAVILAILSFIRIGGFGGLLDSFGRSIAPLDPNTDKGSDMILRLASAATVHNITSLTELSKLSEVPSELKCSLPSKDSFTLLRSVSDPDMPWLGFLLGQTPASIWYWCTDQMMVQRAMAAKSLSHAQGATLMAGFIKLLPLFIMVMPGMISRVLFPETLACMVGDDCYRQCQQRSGCTNLAYPKLVVDLMPSGFRGLMLAVMLAALVSDLTSIFNSASTLFTIDIYRIIRKKSSERELMIVGRLFVVFMVALSIAWVPIVQEQQGSQLFIYIQVIGAYIAPPIASVYLFAVLWKRSTEKGAFTGLMYGLLLGFVRFVIYVVYRDPLCGEEDTRPWIIGQLHYMYFALFSFVTTGIVVIVISLFTEKPLPSQLYRLTFWTLSNPDKDMQMVESTGNITGVQIPLTTNENSVQSVTDGNLLVLSHGEQCCPSNQKKLKESENGANLPITFMELRDGDQYFSKVSETDESNPRPFCFQVLLWLCGCENKPCSDAQEKRCLNRLCVCGICARFVDRERDDAKDATVVSDSPYPKLSTLHQDPRARLFLLLGAAFIITVSTFFFIFFSVYFGPIEPGPLSLNTNENTTIPDNLKSAIKYLQNVGILID